MSQIKQKIKQFELELKELQDDWEYYLANSSYVLPNERDLYTAKVRELTRKIKLLEENIKPC